MPGSGEGSALWPAVGPKAWPPAPNEMSVSALGEIEACPRRWALAAADYPELWERRGYPARVFPASLTGSVIHLAIETVVKALARAACTSVEDADAVQVMKGLGGYTKVINDCIQRVLQRFADNPRATPVLDVALRSLRAQVPELRTGAQSLLGRIMLDGGARGGAPAPARDRPRGPLGPGAYPELELRAPRIGWRGTADLLTLTESGCELVDFKTGAPDDTHRFQVRVYALLWSRDSALNPTGRAVDKLTLSYRDGELSVDPPTPGELDALERELVSRRQAAVKALSESRPQARPSADNCQYCAVRHLCEEYWQPATVRALAATVSKEAPFTDLEISIAARHGPSSWDGIVELSRGVASGKQIVLRSSSPEARFGRGDRIRVMDAHVSTVADDKSQPAVATMTAMTEVFHVPKPVPSFESTRPRSCPSSPTRTAFLARGKSIDPDDVSDTS